MTSTPKPPDKPEDRPSSASPPGPKRGAFPTPKKTIEEARRFEPDLENSHEQIEKKNQS
jgi:hypothetical protein